jgi:hypothetical protein
MITHSQPNPEPQRKDSDLSLITKPVETLLKGVPGADALLAALPAVNAWIDELLAAHADKAIPVSSIGFKRLPDYYSKDFLDQAKVVVIDPVPVPPLELLGLPSLSLIMPGDAAGITYRDTYFVHRAGLRSERLHCHELVHVAQWQKLGSDGFLALYALGLLSSGYRNSPLEEVAYTVEERFARKEGPFDIVGHVEEELSKLLQES